MIIIMTNRSVRLLISMENCSINEKRKIIREVLDIEFSKIIAQANKFSKMCEDDGIVNELLKVKDSDELFTYLNKLNAIEISALASYGIEVAFMNLLKASE